MGPDEDPGAGVHQHSEGGKGAHSLQVKDQGKSPDVADLESGFGLDRFLST